MERNAELASWVGWVSTARLWVEKGFLPEGPALLDNDWRLLAALERLMAAENRSQQRELEMMRGGLQAKTEPGTVEQENLSTREEVKNWRQKIQQKRDVAADTGRRRVVCYACGRRMYHNSNEPPPAFCVDCGGRAGPISGAPASARAKRP